MEKIKSILTIENADREKDVLTLVKGILNVNPTFNCNPNGADTYECPFCLKESYKKKSSLNDIEHSKDCIYLIAKDLSTNLI